MLLRWRLLGILNIKSQRKTERRVQGGGKRGPLRKKEGNSAPLFLVGWEMECVIIIGTQLFTSKGKTEGNILRGI